MLKYKPKYKKVGVYIYIYIYAYGKSRMGSMVYINVFERRFFVRKKCHVFPDFSDKGSSLETLDLAFCNDGSSTPTFYSSARKVSHETKKISAPRRKFVLVMYATNIGIIITASTDWVD